MGSAPRRSDAPTTGAALDTRAGEGDGIDAGPVLAAGTRAGEFGLQSDARGAAEFAHADDERLLQKAALIQVFDEGREALVEPRQEAAFQGVEDVVVRVPAVGVGVVGVFILAAVGLGRDDIDVGTPASTRRRARSIACPVRWRP